MSDLDEETIAAIRYILRGNGPQKNGKFVVTVRGGHVVSVESIFKIDLQQATERSAVEKE